MSAGRDQREPRTNQKHAAIAIAATSGALTPAGASNPRRAAASAIRTGPWITNATKAPRAQALARRPASPRRRSASPTSQTDPATTRTPSTAAVTMGLRVRTAEERARVGGDVTHTRGERERG